MVTLVLLGALLLVWQFALQAFAWGLGSRLALGGAARRLRRGAPLLLAVDRAPRAVPAARRDDRPRGARRRACRRRTMQIGAY